jgi:hypothetical protein
MYRLSFKIALLVMLAFGLQAQSPHGKGFKMDCAKCHDSGSWTFSEKSKFEHSSTGFTLEGQHKNINCNACHTKLEFKSTSSNCVSCHSDMHNQTAGNDCARCHSTQSWIVENIGAMHDKTSFPLVGVHKSVDCKQCHQSETNVRFNPTGQTCIDCHTKNFASTKNPSHTKLSLSTDCSTCHSTTTAEWKSRTFPDHDSFYPLTGAHTAIAKDCEKCHIGGNYNNTPKECVGCHNKDFAKTANPNHAKLNLSTDCASCHTTAPGWAPATFPVHDEFYPLTGAHRVVANNCAVCHKSGNYSSTPNDCNSCHNADYKASINPNHNTLNLSTDCASCHTTNPDWSPAQFTAHDEFYPLTGAHKNLSCNECHKGGNYNNTPKDCNACHKDAFTASKDPNHTAMGFSTDCSSCHSTSPGWSPSTFNHNTFYPLTGAHETIKSDCNKCHTGANYKNPSTDCNSCHSAAYAGTKNPSHVTFGLSTDCASCHTTNPGWRPSTFDHSKYYPLTGAHAPIASECVKCHSNGVSNTSSECVSCHAAAYNSAKDPNHALMDMSKNCASCHTTNPGWSPSTFDHNKFFALTDGHAAIARDCNKCHNGTNYKNPPTDCNACHNGAYKSAANPNHAALGLSTDCASCHTTNPGWKPSSFNHNNYYALTGAHANIASDCIKCHAKGVSNTPTDCNSCHNAAYKATNSPNHAALSISTDCASCHTTNPGWRPSTFNHGAYYQLTGAHANIANDCIKCHANGVGNTPTDCNACHNMAYKATKNPNHAALSISTDCASCHTTNPGWRPSTFNHGVYYQLTGAHANIASDCIKCHSNSVSNTPTDCNACHNNAYKSATNPSHSVLGLSTDCASCHSTNPGWRPTSFNHNNYYQLTGAHSGIANNCVQCHASGVNNTSTDCNSCHNGAYQSAKNPNHVGSGFSTDCASCHSTNPGWRPSTFNHNNVYPLTGAHANIATNCTQCHIAGNFNNTPTDCNSCHSGAYNGASNPNHAASGFSRDCASCHTTNPGWRPSTFNHNNFYPLTGAHANVASNCTQCHIGGNFNNTPTDCNSCHSGAYNSASNPNHSASGFSRDCATCHTTNPGWRPSTFNHNNFYPLVGAHANIANNCTQCHAGGNFNNTPNQCIGCHQKNYDGASPNHRNSGFSTNCLECHSQNAWKPSTFNHDAQYFPIYSGKHKGKWNSCTDCHTTAGNYSIFSCFRCHGKSETDKDHKEVKGYTYNSNACLSCHPDGKH